MLGELSLTCYALYIRVSINAELIVMFEAGHSTW